MGIDFPDSAYTDVGARIVGTAPEVFAASDMIVKVKEPQPSEIALLEARHTAVHLPPSCGRQAPGRGPDEVGRDLHRL